MSNAQLMELEFESNLCRELAERGWLYENDGKPSGWDVGLAIVPTDVLHWLATQYPDEYEKAVPGDLVNGQKDDAERKLLAAHHQGARQGHADGPDHRATRSAGCSACCARASPTPRSAVRRRSSAR